MISDVTRVKSNETSKKINLYVSRYLSRFSENLLTFAVQNPLMVFFLCNHCRAKFFTFEIGRMDSCLWRPERFMTTIAIFCDPTPNSGRIVGRTFIHIEDDRFGSVKFVQISLV